MSSLRVAKLVDVCQYAVGLVLLVTAVLVPISFGTGSGLWGVKYGLFLLGTLTMGYATLLAWPRSPSDLESEGESRSETGLQKALRQLPPATWYPIRPEDRYLDWKQLYLASACMWAVSFLLEAGLGV